MKFCLIGISLFLVSIVNAGVERFLKPISFPSHAGDGIQKKTSAFFSNSHSSHTSSSHISDSGSQSLDRSMLEARLSELLKHRYQVEGKVLAFLGREWTPLKVSSNFQVKIRDCNPEELVGSTFARFSIWDKGQKKGDFSMPLRLAHMQDVLFSKVPLTRGATPTLGSFELREVDVLKSHANSVPASAKLSGYQIDSNLKPGNPLKWNLLSKTTLIEKGDLVNVFASGNGIYVTMKGVALENGVKDSTVRVKNISSNKEFSAKVLDGNSVKVHL